MNITLAIIAVNAVVSVVSLYFYPQLLRIFVLKPHRVFAKNTWYEVITSGFVHAGMAHLLFNMITLYFFGPVIEGLIGGGSFTVLYFGGLLFSSLPSLIKHRHNPQYATLGASGAVESVLFAYILIFPFDKLYLLFIPVGIPAFLFGIGFIAYSIYAGKQEGRINHEAHIAGAAWGIIYMLLFVPRAAGFVLQTWGLG